LQRLEALKKNEERGDETQFTTKIGGKKLVWVPVLLFCKISFPITHLMPFIMPKLAVLAPLIA
jgi:hypothetical protein